jgi:hypothetical protein
MPGDQRQFRIRQLPIYDVQIRPADCARVNFDQDLIRVRLWYRNIGCLKRVTRFFENHCEHEKKEMHFHISSNPLSQSFARHQNSPPQLPAKAGTESGADAPHAIHSR